MAESQQDTSDLGFDLPTRDLSVMYEPPDGEFAGRLCADLAEFGLTMWDAGGYDLGPPLGDPPAHVKLVVVSPEAVRVAMERFRQPGIGDPERTSKTGPGCSRRPRRRLARNRP